MSYEIGGAYNGENQPSRPGQILIEANTLGENTEILHKLIVQIEEQLSSMMRPGPPEVRTNGTNVPIEKEPEHLAPHAEFLRTRNNQLHMLIRKLEHIRDRLEI